MKLKRAKITSNYKIPPPPIDSVPVESLIRQLLPLRKEMLEREQNFSELKHIPVKHHHSACNLLHYMVMRSHDLRDLQIPLGEWGLSSLGRAERKVLATFDMVLYVLHVLAGKAWKPREKPALSFKEARTILENNTAKLFGETPQDRRVRIMVTMPTEASTNYELVRNLLMNGMNCARINSVHDDPAIWKRTIDNIRKASEITGRPCKILLDLGGPKLRTAPLQPGPQVIKVRPRRNDMGTVLEPAKIWICPEEYPAESPVPVSASLSAPAAWLRQCVTGDQISTNDARGAKRKLVVVREYEKGLLLTSERSLYLVPDLKFTIDRNTKLKHKKTRISSNIPPVESFIPLKMGDHFKLLRSTHIATVPESDSKLCEVPSIGCSVPEVLNDVQIGEPIWFDDGKIGGLIESLEEDHVVVRITHARPDGERLRGGKGINLPESNLKLRAMSEEDKANLGFAVKYVDSVGLSFINTVKDVEELIDELHQLSKNPPGIVVKIETRQAFDNLPSIILAAMRANFFGVMIARGDLAIECGFGRLAEIQEEILWISEAAHAPVIWATQVMEGMTKDGQPSRAEVTDAAMGQRSECIMLNKGEHIVAATKALSDILARMQDHQTKKRALLRKLQLAEKFFQDNEQGEPEQT
jgi:pyruvate kinase